MVKVVFFIFFLVTPITIFSQIHISGQVLSEEQAPISQANITITDSADVILAYSITRKDGRFSIQLDSKSETLILNVRAMNYSFHSEIIENKTQSFEISLSPEITVLKEAVIKQRPIRQKGDTLSYDVSAFQEQKDRVIADVLKKMPGIEIEPSGRILYQGNPINKYYIEGLDLLEGKYSLANENLPADAVSSVQILENHQPIKMLDSLVYSDKAALNIKLKKNITTTGTAELGAGFSPMLWKTNVTPMFFNKKQQMIASYQGNNIGEDVSLQLRTLTLADLLNQSETRTHYNWLSVSNALTPPIPEKRWLDNEVHLGTINFLTKWKNDYDFRVNAAYYNDYQKQLSNSKTTYYFPSDTISIVENRRNSKLTNHLNTKFSLLKNNKSNYFQNVLEFKGNWENQHGMLDNLNQTIDQKTEKPSYLIANRFSTILPVGTQFITLSSNVSYESNQENLSIVPGQFTEMLNDLIETLENRQIVDFERFYLENHVGITKQLGYFTFAPKIGSQFIAQNFDSQLGNQDGGLVGESYQNDLNWKQFKNYLHLNLQFNKRKWKVSLDLPVEYYLLAISDPNLKKISTERLLALPSLSIGYQPNSFWVMNLNANLDNQFGNINNLYFKYLLRNYRTLERINTSILPHTFSQNYSVSVNYKNPIKSLFGSLNYRFSNSKNNLIYNQTMDENGNSILVTEENDNSSINHSVSGKISKYFSDIGSTVGFNTNYTTQKQAQVFNGEFIYFRNYGWIMGAKINTNPWDWFSFEYDGKVLLNQNQINKHSAHKINSFQHSFSLNFYLFDNHFFQFRTDYFRNDFNSDKHETIFSDLKYRFTFPKTKIDLEASWTNIFSQDYFTTVSNSSIYYSQQTSKLRPSEFFLSIKFSF